MRLRHLQELRLLLGRPGTAAPVPGQAHGRHPIQDVQGERARLAIAGANSRVQQVVEKRGALEHCAAVRPLVRYLGVFGGEYGDAKLVQAVAAHVELGLAR